MVEALNGHGNPQISQFLYMLKLGYFEKILLVVYERGDYQSRLLKEEFIGGGACEVDVIFSKVGGN
ncbi:hypothetical protein HPP92_011318 [Vanilla planifolia]|uniref:Uncharacterized protein n=1 Tax=Vanilla planifolia TaxID=51239 RepID=A0A835V0W9_VANPL|nr:hypothetical protein HPP92_011318 [Vanilla planifolia]